MSKYITHSQEKWFYYKCIVIVCKEIKIVKHVAKYYFRQRSIYFAYLVSHTRTHVRKEYILAISMSLLQVTHFCLIIFIHLCIYVYLFCLIILSNYFYLFITFILVILISDYKKLNFKKERGGEVREYILKKIFLN